MIEAVDEKEAFQKAQRLGRLDQESFYNINQQLVKWNFIDVCEMYKLSELMDGAELYSRVQEADDAGTYIEMVRHKADYLQGDNVMRSLQLI